jgi:hypothetical protein
MLCYDVYTTGSRSYDRDAALPRTGKPGMFAQCKNGNPNERLEWLGGSWMDISDDRLDRLMATVKASR